MQASFAVLLLLFAAVLSQSPNVRPRYEKFINQHINMGMSVGRCDQVIGQRRITETDSNLCKETNTFIRAATGRIRDVCGSAGSRYGDLTKSNSRFDIVVCKLRNKGARKPHCQYTGQSYTRHIAIRCEEGFPVHYGRDIVYLEQ